MQAITPLPTVIVDDDPVVVECLNKMLKRHAMLEVYAFTQSARAMQTIEALDIRFVFADYNMPFLDGEELLRRCMDLDRGIQFVMISADGSLARAEKCLRLGACEILPKPILTRDVDMTVKDSLFFFDRWENTLRNRQRYQQVI